jgi:hypothetical protein
MPDRILMLGRSKGRRALMASLCRKIGEKAHCSTKVVKRDYLPYLRLIARKDRKFELDGIELEKEELKLLRG